MLAFYLVALFIKIMDIESNKGETEMKGQILQWSFRPAVWTLCVAMLAQGGGQQQDRRKHWDIKKGEHEQAMLSGSVLPPGDTQFGINTEYITHLTCFPERQVAFKSI